MGIDNRILRTKHDLRQALIHLLLTNDFNTINVKLICNQALIHKQTFYKYYKDKYDLFNDVITTLIDDSISKIDTNNSKDFFTLVVSNIINTATLYKNFIISLSKNELLVEIIHNALVKYTKLLLNKFKHNRVLKYDINYVSSGIVGALENIILDFLVDNNTKNKDTCIKQISDIISSIIDNDILFTDKSKL